MDLFSIQTVLLAGKWLFVGLVYFVLLVVLVGVRREMAQHVRGGQALASAAVGRLVVVQPGSDSGVRPGTMWHLKTSNTLGADEASDVVLGDEMVSGQHARLRWDGASWWLEDAGSTNGTLVNGQRLMPLLPQRVPVGSRLELGAMVLELQE
jgi:hypothetical protein